jgi:hypothetical protein
MPTGLDDITSAMKIAGILGQNETPTSSEADDGLVALNDMLDSFSIDRTFIYSVNQNNFPLVNGTASYTIGTGGTFNMARPTKIDNVFIRINGVDFPLKELNNQDYDAIPFKTNGEFPMYFYYDAAFPLGTIYIYGVPTQGTIYIDTWQVITQFTNLATNLTYPPGYNRMIRYNLAKELCPMYGMTLSTEAMQTATESLANIKDRNLPEYVMKTEVGYLNDGQGYIGYRGY